jgi:putative MATE family efflux protein
MQDLTTGPVGRHLLKTTSFMLVTMVFQTLYFLADLYWVGRLGKEAVAAVGVAGNLTFVVLAATQMLAVGTTTLISHAAGQKDHRRATLVFNQSLVLGFASGSLFFVAGTLLRTPYATAIAADARTAELADQFLSWFVPAMSLQFPVVSMSAALRGTGNFKPGMVVQTTTVVVNIVITPFLVFGLFGLPALGVRGAAVASFLALVIGTVWLTAYFRGPAASLHVRPGEWRPRLALWAAMLKVGLPAGAEFALTAVYLLIVYTVIRPFGAAAQAAVGIGLRIIQASFLPVVALGFAVAPVAGQNFGAGLASRVRETFRAGAMMASALMAVITLVCIAVPKPLIAVFSDDADVIATGAEYLRIVALNFLPSGIVFVASSLFQAMGNTIPPLLTSCGRLLLIGAVLTLIAPMPGFHLAWIWYLAVAATWLQMGASLLLLRREFARRLSGLTSVERAAG